MDPGDGASLWMRSLAALLSSARACEMESSDGVARSSSRESDRQMGSDSGRAGWRTANGSGEADSTSGVDLWTQPTSYERNGAHAHKRTGFILHAILHDTKLNYEWERSLFNLTLDLAFGVGTILFFTL